MFGELLGSIVRIVNAPIRAMEDVFSGEPIARDERIMSMPLDALADNFDKIDDGDND